MNTKLNLILVALSPILPVILSGCKDEAQVTQQKYPYLTPVEISKVNGDGAVFTAKFDRPGTSAVTDYGFEWAYEYSSYDHRVSLGTNVKTEFSTTVTQDLWPDKNYRVRPYAVTADNTVYGGDVGFKAAGSLPPQVISISPTHGPGNTQVTITGKNLGAGDALNQKSVSLGYYNSLTIISFSDNTIVAKVPPPGFMPKGQYNIQLTFGPRIYTFNNVSFTFE
jgi:hypothetical protein